MAQYIFLLGKAGAICQVELDTLLSSHNLKAQYVDQKFALVSSDDQDRLMELAQRSGGIVKLAIVLDGENSPEEIISNDISNYTKPVFSIIGLPSSKSSQIKKHLKDRGIQSRYLEMSDLYDTATSLHKNHQEYWFNTINKSQAVCKVIWTQNIRTWAKRDFARPKSDPKSGMLPPKIARMMINCAVRSEQNQVIYDPFCGSGTIVAEALARGFDAYGSDISKDAVEDTIENTTWLSNISNTKMPLGVFVADAAHVQAKDFPKRPTAIVFEPYMGPPHINPEKIKDIAKGLEKLYIGALKNLGKLQQAGELLVGIFPAFELGSTVKTTDNFIDRCENFGYTRKVGPLEYKRPHAIVVRRIYVLEKSQTKESYVTR